MKVKVISLRATAIAAGVAALAVAGVATAAVIKGTNGDDTLRGTRGADAISAYAGNDTVAALAGADIVRAGAGDDQVLVAREQEPELPVPPPVRAAVADVGQAELVAVEEGRGERRAHAGPRRVCLGETMDPRIRVLGDAAQVGLRGALV